MSKKKSPNKAEKNQSDIVTKESLSAVGALFCALAFFVLCTGASVFGDIGATVRSFLLGVFGYAAYPLFALGTYVCLMGLMGLRLVKNRKAGWAFGLFVAFLALLLHTVFTYGWAENGYLSACFKAGETFSGATVAGWLGGVIAFALSALTTKIGSIVIFSALCLFCVYLFWLSVRKKAVAAREEAPAPVQEEPAAPQQSAASQAQPQFTVADATQNANHPMDGYGEYTGSSVNDGAVYHDPAPAEHYGAGLGGYAYAPFNRVDVHQKPAFTLGEDAQQERAVNKNGFSPFAGDGSATNVPQSGQAPQQEEQSGRDFLFGFTPAESYRKNLIFDANANVNKPRVQQPAAGNAFTPSYLSSYENSVNERTEETPKKVFGETPSYSSFTPVQPTQPAQPIHPQTGFGDPYSLREEGKTFAVETNPEPPTFNARNEEPFGRGADDPFVRLDEGTSFLSDRGTSEVLGTDRGSFDRGASTPPVPPVEETPATSSRNEFMNYFSQENPNVFGGAEEGRGENEPTSFPSREGRDGGLRDSADLPSFDGGERGATRLPDFSERNTENEYTDRTDRDRGGLNIFDEKDDELPFETERGRGEREEFSIPSTRFEGRGEDVRGEDTRGERGRGRFGFIEEEEDEPLVPVRTDPPAPAAKKAEPPPPPPKPRVIRPYTRVPLDYFDCRDVMPDANEVEVAKTKSLIVETLGYFKVNDATVSSVTFGPTVTRYNVVVPRNIPARKVVALDQEIALTLQAKAGVNIYPNFEDGAVSIEVPNRNRQFVQLGCMLTGDSFVNAKPSSLMFAMGKDVGNRKVYGDICKMIHLLVAGSSGSGKSVFLGSLIISLISKYSPAELRLILIDPKKTEFVLYNNLPHLMINEIITEVGKAVQSLNWAIGEMNRRYALFEQMSRAGTYVVNIDEYNSHLKEGEEKLPKIVIIIDELADLMLAAKKEIEDRIQNLTQKARAAGIHLIVATQRPSADVITGVIKGNLPTRIAFAVASDVDSRVILDQTGAQKLLGKGDFLYTMSGINTPVRVQSAFISSEESQNVINFIKMNNDAYFDESATAYINNTRSASGDSLDAGEEGVEEVYIEALRFVILSGSASISMIQRKCSVGYNKAGKIVEWMEEMGYISSFDGAKARKVLITKEEFESKFGAL